MAQQKLSAVIYDSKALIPAPFVALNRVTHRTGDGQGVGHSLTATLTGKLVACKGWDFSGGQDGVEYYTGSGYPPDDSSCCKFANILEMQDRVRKVFRIDNEYHWFEIQSLEDHAHPPHKWLARVQDVQFKEGQWVETAEYIITLELLNSAAEFGDELTAQKMSDVQHSERWEIQFRPEDAGAYQLTHTISCSAKQFTAEESVGSLVENWDESNGPKGDPNTGTGGVVDGWKEAKRWVRERLAFLDTQGTPKLDDDVIFNFGFLLTGYVPYNYQKNQVCDQLEGNFSVTETWIMSKCSVVSSVSIVADTPRDGDYTVKVSGNFRSFLNAAGNNTEDAITAFDAWDGAGSAFTLAQAAYVGVRTLNNCPVTKTVTKNKQYCNSDEQHYADNTRVVEFSYEFSDGGDALCDSERVITYKENKVPSDGCVHTVTIEGNIQGHRCANNSPDEPMINAEACYNAYMTIADSEAAGYGATLILISKSVSRDARKGTIRFNLEYSDAFPGGVRREETITEAWSCNERNSEGNALTTLQIDGNITSLCDGGDGNLSGLIPASRTYNANYPTACLLVKSSITKDELHRRVSYSYTFEEDCGTVRIETETSTKRGPDKCDTYVTVHCKITGLGCSDSAAQENANNYFATLVPSSLGPSGYCMISSVVNKSSRGIIDATYEFASTGDAETTITITESYDSQDCGIKKTRIQGEIKGCCSAEGGAYAAASVAYSALNFPAMCDGYITAHSRTNNEREGRISFTVDCEKRPKPYVEEKTITVKCDVDQPYTIVAIEGTIVPLCITDQAAQVVAGNAAWAEVSGTLGGIAAGSCGSGYGCDNGIAILKRSSVSISQISGRVQYSVEYACMRCQRVPNSLEESIEITCNKGAIVVALVPILGRQCGPLLQNKFTRRETTISISVNFRFKPNCCNLSKPSGIDDAMNAIISGASGCGCPSGCRIVNIYTSNDVESWNPCTGRYSRQVTKLLECC